MAEGVAPNAGVEVAPNAGVVVVEKPKPVFGAPVEGAPNEKPFGRIRCDLDYESDQTVEMMFIVH